MDHCDGCGPAVLTWLLAVPPGIDLSAYRIVQEALTNVIKHAAAASASVTIRYRTPCSRRA